MKGGIWIAAGQGLSRYSARRRKRRFFPYEEVKVRTTQVAVLLAEKCKASQHLAKEAPRASAPKDVFLRGLGLWILIQLRRRVET